MSQISKPGCVQRGATEAAEAARIFEGQLAGALVAENGQLALSNLAASAAHGFMPKIQTQGQLGQARWRLVSAPSIPGTLKPNLIYAYKYSIACLCPGPDVESDVLASVVGVHSPCVGCMRSKCSVVNTHTYVSADNQWHHGNGM